MLPAQQTSLYAMQHLLVAVLGAIPVPLIIGSSVNADPATTSFLVSATLFVAGIATLIHSLGLFNFAGAKVPGIMGVSFATVAACISVVKSHPDLSTGFRSIAGASIIAGIFAILIGPIWSKIVRFFPLVVVGCIVTIIGVSLLTVPVGWITNQQSSADPKQVYMALFVFLTVILLSKFLKGIAQNLAVLFSLIIGTIVAHICGLTDFSGVSSASSVGIVVPFKFGAPIFEISAIFSFIIIMFLNMTEVTGTLMGTHKIVDKPIDQKIIRKAMNGVGIIAIIAGIFSSTICTIFAPNVGLIELSRVKSRYVTAFTGVGLILVSMLPKVAALITAIPLSVLGGAGFAMFGMVAASGISILSEVSYAGNHNKLIVALSIGLAMIPTTKPEFFTAFPTIIQIICGGGITIGAITAIILNIIFNELNISKKAGVSNESTNIEG